METIWKYELEVIDTQEIFIPNGFEVLAIKTQHGKPCLWARVDPERSKLNAEIRIHGTGHDVPETTGKYLGTFQIHDGELVFHVFIRGLFYHKR